jgi:hypothetical protein
VVGAIGRERVGGTLGVAVGGGGVGRGERERPAPFGKPNCSRTLFITKFRRLWKSKAAHFEVITRIGRPCLVGGERRRIESPRREETREKAGAWVD